MKFKLTFLNIILFSFGFNAFAQMPQAFTKGNFSPSRVQKPSGSGGSIFLQEYTSFGGLAQHLDFNGSALVAPNNKVVSPSIGTGETEFNYLSLSGDKKFLTFAGFVTPASGNIAVTGNTRVAALVKYDGVVNTQTTFTGSSYLFTTASSNATASTSLTIAPNSALIVNGSIISGTGIPVGTTITAFNTTSRVATLSQAATVASGVALTIELNSPATNFIPKSAVTSYVTGIYINYSGFSSSANGVLYQPIGSTGAPINILASGTSYRQMNISSLDNNLYVGRNNAGFTFFTGTPTSKQSSTNGLPSNAISGVLSINGSRGYCFVQPNGGGEVMYVAAASTASNNGGSTSAGSNTLTFASAISTPANFAVNNRISGLGLTSGTTITGLSVDNKTITLSQPAISTQSSQAYWSIAPSLTLYGIYKFYRSSNANSWTSAGGFGLAADNYLTVTAEPKVGGGFTLYATKYNPTGNGISATASATNVTAILTDESNQVVLNAPNTNFAVGNQILGTGIPIPTHIVAISADGLTLTISNNATTTGATTLTNYPTVGLPSVVQITDAEGLADMSGTETIIVRGAYQQAFRGIAMSPYDVTLPITLKSFTAQKQNGNGLLNWTTKSESNVKNFEIEKSITGSGFRTVGKVLPLNSPTGGAYSLIDKEPLLQTTYYRLKTIDNDGQFAYSQIEVINQKLESLSNVFPNPAQDIINIELTGIQAGATFNIYSVSGISVMERVIPANALTQSVDISNLNSATYILQLNNGTSSSRHKFIKK